ncbi:MAG: hypothetical protein IAF38_21370 [Bacteroidia bacterium]|nr:hypothetical protein [Bacteroidia bacterium]
MRVLTGIIFFTLFLSVGFSQVDTLYTTAGFLKIPNNPDSVAYTKDYAFNEGVYLNYKAFRTGDAIPRAMILSRVEKNQLEFYNKLVNESDTIVYRYGTGIKLILTDSIWGYIQNNVVYLNVEGTFCRLSVFGNVSHFLGTISVEAFKSSGPFYDPSQAGGGSSITGVPLKAKETHEFIFDFYTGRKEIAKFEVIEEILKRDPELYKEYAALKKKQKRDKMYIFLKRYNQKHPAYFPRLG